MSYHIFVECERLLNSSSTYVCRGVSYIWETGELARELCGVWEFELLPAECATYHRFCCRQRSLPVAPPFLVSICITFFIMGCTE